MAADEQVRNELIDRIDSMPLEEASASMIVDELFGAGCFDERRFRYTIECFVCPARLKTNDTDEMVEFGHKHKHDEDD
jgi:hypothetical protein